MVKILISGALGKMGKKVAEVVNNCADAEIVCGVDKVCSSELPFPVCDGFSSVKKDVDVIIDFSSPANLDALLSFSKEKKCGAVLCTTGYSDDDIKKINDTAKSIPLFRSANMSLGVNVLIDLVKKAAATLPDFDAEIVEMHHNEKADAPSGTALMLADGIKEVLPDNYNVYGRSGKTGKRNKNEIGIHALRGGTVVGEHKVIFAGKNETVVLSHSATDRGVFAEGALKAALYLSKKKNGLFDMSDMINGR